ncbi:MAG: SDR family oxidoreductase, partial [Alphaproteobacteria bacterium]|nr:SDR family oxidoreductase [Alphaproteobacteria bacterium]MCB9928364.1 SDR family oxidoreductase [Alphaproteobacteria bacterium]
MMTLDGKVALVSGAAGGIGRAAVAALAAAGATVVAAVETEAQRADLNPACLLDVRFEDQWRDCVARIEREFGRLDVLVNNAGILREANCEDTDTATWDLVHDINLKGVFLGCKAAIPALRRAGGGAIVNVASIDGIRGNFSHIAYSASKGGVVALTRSLAMDHAEENIRVNAVCPGTVNTPLVASMLWNFSSHEEALEAARRKHPMGRIAEPEEVGSLIAFLAGPGASFMTGMAVPVDGGRSARA